MPNWNEVLQEIAVANQSPLDRVRRKYLMELHEKTDRNVICYYSGWLQKPESKRATIQDDDKNGLMAAVHGLKDRGKGLDLLLHTPGGEITATESIVHYLRQMFGTDINVIIPQIAMSAGTMIACASKKIYMGKQSNIGPIDPQFNGIPAHGVLDEFSRAIDEIRKNPASIPIWQAVINKYHPTFVGECENAIELSSDIVEEWLITGMFEGDKDASAKAKKIVEKLNNHKDTKAHGRHIHLDQARAMGLRVDALEDGQDMQDLVLTIHHAYMHSFSSSKAIKIIENHMGHAFVQAIG